jgi:hypothetical protein
MQGEHAFEIGSNVGRYWLARAEGFDVVAARGRRVGVVEDLVVNPRTLEVSVVVVRRRFTAWMRRPARVPVGDLRTVLPGSRRFVLTPTERPARAHAWAAVAGRQGTLAARRTGHASAIAARHTGHASAIAARHTGHAVAVGTAAVATQTRARWPTVRHSVGVAADRTGRALASAAVRAAALIRRSWRTGGARLRKSGLYARARALATRPRPPAGS